VIVGGGVKGTAGVASSSAQAGAFITVDNYGTVTGVGGMTSSSTAVGADLGVVSVGAQTDTGARPTISCRLRHRPHEITRSGWACATPGESTLRDSIINRANCHALRCPGGVQI